MAAIGQKGPSTLKNATQLNKIITIRMVSVDLENITKLFQTQVIDRAPSFFGALIVFLVGWIAINIIVNGVKNSLVKKGADATLVPFLGSMTNSLLKVALIITLLGMVGVKTTSFVAILGTVGLAVGFALRDSLSNFAGGVLVLIFRPVKVGDFVELGTVSGTVKEIQIFSTILTTTDNKTIIVPNGVIANGTVINYSTQKTRRVEWIFSIDYGDDFEKAKALVQDFLSKDSRVLKDPAPFVRVGALGASSVDITVRVWANKDDYWPLFHDTLEGIKIIFDKEGLRFPFPQREISYKNAPIN